MSSDWSKNTNIRVKFIDAEAEDLGHTISLELDSEANSDATEFQSGSSAYIKQFPSGDYDLFVNIGSVRKTISGNVYLVTEEVVNFINAERAVLDYEPLGAVTYRWVGISAGNPRFSGRVVKLPETGTGVLLCTYRTQYDQLEVFYAGDEETDILLTVTEETTNDDGEEVVTTASLTIPYKVSEVATRPVILTVSDYCSDDVIVGATIILSGPGYPATEFTTNALGQVDFGELTIGLTYDIVITAEGYKDSDSDSLRNDSFTISELPEDED